MKIGAIARQSAAAAKSQSVNRIGERRWAV